MKLNIAKWVAWAPGIDTASDWSRWQQNEISIDGSQSPDITFVDAMLRRRLSRFARMALYVAQRCATEINPINSVFASRHGELNSTVKMLRNLHQQEPLSPTAFSLSVHNAPVGVFSIVRQDRSPTTAIAAGRESFIYGLIDALGQLKNYSQPVLFVYADEPIAQEYQQFEPYPEYPHAIALLLDNSGEAITVDAAPKVTSNTVHQNLPQSLAFLHFLIDQTSQNAVWCGERHDWTWSRENVH